MTVFYDFWVPLMIIQVTCVFAIGYPHFHEYNVKERKAIFRFIHPVSTILNFRRFHDPEINQKSK